MVYSKLFVTVLFTLTVADAFSFDPSRAQTANGAKACDQTFKDARAKALIGDGKDAALVGVLVAKWKGVRIRGCLGEREAQKGEAVVIGDQIITGPKGRARIEFNDRDDARKWGPSVMNIGPKSRVLVQSFRAPIRGQRKKTHFELFIGTIRWFMRGSGGRTDSYSVKAGIAQAGMRGTDVIIQVSRSGMAGLVREGTMVIQGPVNRVEVKPGQMALLIRVHKGGRIGVGPWNSLVKNAWQKILKKIEIPLHQ